jgi:hypothetical protein
MKLYDLQIACHIDNLDTLDKHMDVNLTPADAFLVSLVLQIAPAHLRKIADDIESQAKQKVVVLHDVDDDTDTTEGEQS